MLRFSIFALLTPKEKGFQYAGGRVTARVTSLIRITTRTPVDALRE